MLRRVPAKAQAYLGNNPDVVPIRHDVAGHERAERIRLLAQRVERLHQALEEAHRVQRYSRSLLAATPSHSRSDKNSGSGRTVRHLPEIVLTVLAFAAILLLPIQYFSALDEAEQVAIIFFVPTLLCLVILGAGSVWRAILDR